MSLGTDARSSLSVIGSCKPYLNRVVGNRWSWWGLGYRTSRAGRHCSFNCESVMLGAGWQALAVGVRLLRKRLFRLLIVSLASLYGVTACYHLHKPLPDGLDVATPWRAATELVWLEDWTFLDAAGEQHSEAAIFDAAFDLIAGAERLVVLDMFLVNEFAGDVADGHRPLSEELVEALRERKQAREDLTAVLITDPFNTLYGGRRSEQFEALRKAGVEVVITNLRPLRDSNPAWSALWRICCQWFGNNPDGAWLADPVGAGKVTLRSYLELANFKANHRKTLVVDQGDDWAGLVTSANPHDASSLHSNQALVFQGPAALDLLQTERAVMQFSGADGSFTWPEVQAGVGDEADDGAELRIVTESQVRAAALAMIEAAQPGGRLDLAMFYLAHRQVLAALLAAHERGVAIRVLLDPNKGAFGRQGIGVPNRQTGMELMRAGVPVRWCNTDGEQCHSKYLLSRDPNGNVELLAGSANFTRRNLDNFNLETNVHVRGAAAVPALAAAVDSFEARWRNEAGKMHSVDYAVYADHSRLRYALYRFMEATGISTF